MAGRNVLGHLPGRCNVSRTSWETLKNFYKIIGSVARDTPGGWSRRLHIQSPPTRAGHPRSARAVCADPGR